MGPTAATLSTAPPSNDLQAAYRSICCRVARLCQQEINAEFIQQVCQEAAALGLTQEEQIDLALCAVYMKIQEIVDGIIAEFPTEVQERASSLFEKIEEELSSGSSSS